MNEDFPGLYHSSARIPPWPNLASVRG
jgi:hypothetical protein